MATTLLNLPPHGAPSTDTGSDPGTPASGISTLSTTAIKDGHEGHHPHMNFEVAAERVARLGGIGSPQNASSQRSATPTRDYFESSNTPNTPGTSSVVSSMADEHGSVEGDAYGANSTQAKRQNMAEVFARRQNEQSSGATPSGGPTSAMNNNVSTIAPAVSPLPRASNAPDGDFPYNNFSRSTDSPASTQTTPSVAEARVDAKLIDGMTYDEGDTTGEGLGRRDTIRPGQIPPGLNRDTDTSMEG